MYYLIMAEVCFAVLLALTFVMCKAAVMSVKMMVDDCQYINVLGWKIVLMDGLLTVLTVLGTGFTLFLSGTLTYVHFYIY